TTLNPSNVKLCATDSKTTCKEVSLPVRLQSGNTAAFQLWISADSTRDVEVKPIVGKASVLQDSLRKDVFNVTPQAAGKLVFEVIAIPKPKPVASPRPVIVTVYLDEEKNSDPSVCARLFANSIVLSPRLDANAIVGLLGSPKPFSLKAAGKGKVLIFSSR